MDFKKVVHRFTTVEMFNDNNGKTQAILVCGFAEIVCGLVGVGLCIGMSALLGLMRADPDIDLIKFFSESKDTCATIIYSGSGMLATHVFTKSTVLNSKESVSSTTEIIQQQGTNN